MGAGLYTPTEIRVAVGAEGMPTAITLRGSSRRVVRVQNSWRIDDEWWREEISRHYYLVELEDGSLETVFQDLASAKWYRQRW